MGIGFIICFLEGSRFSILKKSLKLQKGFPFLLAPSPALSGLSMSSKTPIREFKTSPISLTGNLLGHLVYVVLIYLTGKKRKISLQLWTTFSSPYVSHTPSQPNLVSSTELSLAAEFCIKVAARFFVFSHFIPVFLGYY